MTLKNKIKEKQSGTVMKNFGGSLVDGWWETEQRNGRKSVKMHQYRSHVLLLESLLCNDLDCKL